MNIKTFNFELSKELDSIVLFPLADVHLGERLLDSKKLMGWREEVLSLDSSYIIINGDMLNNATINSVSDVYNEVLTPNQQIDKAVEFLYPIKDKILVISEGNHERRTAKQSGVLLLDRVSKELFGAKEASNHYSNGAFLAFIAFGKNFGRESRKTVYSIYGRHGSGGGKRIGGKANSLEDMLNVVNADIFLHSHTHVPIGFRMGYHTVDYRNRIVRETDHLFVNTNAFLRFGGYGENFGFRPASTNYPKIYLDGYKREAKVLI